MLEVWLHRLIQAARDLNIRNKLFIAFIVLNLIPLAVISVWTYQKSSSLIQEQTNIYTMDMLSEVSKNIELHMHDIERLYYAIFTNQEIRESLKAVNRQQWSPLQHVSADKRIRNILYGLISDREDVEGVSLYALDGTSFQTSTYPRKLDLRDQNWQVLQRNRGDLTWFNPSGQQSVVAAVSTIYDVDSLQKIGYFLLTYHEEALYKVYSQIKLNEQGELFIIDSHGQIISSGNKASIHHTPTEAYLQKIITSGDTGDFADHIDDKQQIVSYQRIQNTDWKIVSIIPTARYSEQSIVLQQWMLILFIIVALITLILGYSLSVSISRPIRQLSSIMKNTERDNWSISFNYPSRDEIGILSLNFNRMIARIHYLINQVYEEERLRQQSQLKFLMFQINPHFLFNTLETMNWMARIEGVPEVGKLSKALGDLMREGIKGKEFITLSEELESVKKYIYIQKVRYVDKFDMQYDIDPAVLSLIVPRFILQPIIENAIVHGLEMQMENGMICIHAHQSEDTLILSIHDDGLGMNTAHLETLRHYLDHPSDSSLSGIGLLNVHQRIQLHYGEDYGLQIESLDNQGTTVILHIPSDHFLENRSEFSS